MKTNIAIFIFKTAKLHEKQGTPLLIEKHPFINDAKCCKMKHEVMALTMDQYVSGKTYGFHANRIENRKYYSSG